jgi:hypothetical protein
VIVWGGWVRRVWAVRALWVSLVEEVRKKIEVVVACRSWLQRAWVRPPFRLGIKTLSNFAFRKSQGSEATINRYGAIFSISVLSDSDRASWNTRIPCFHSCFIGSERLQSRSRSRSEIDRSKSESAIYMHIWGEEHQTKVESLSSGLMWYLSAAERGVLSG